MTTTRSDWTDQQERLLFAAQAVVNDAEEKAGNPPIYCIDAILIDKLVVVVQEIHDDALRTIRAAAQEVRTVTREILK